MKNIIFTLLILSSTSVMAQQQDKDVHKLFSDIIKCDVRNEIRLPKVDGLIPLKCDFHSHTLFSDGHVWPSMRVEEAWADGLDAIAITDHLEFRPKKNIIKGDFNESNRIAKKFAKNRGIIVVEGTELSRSKPIGHLNALFIKDANLMDIESPTEAIDIALSQGAYILWNHPGWPDDKSTLYPIHKELIKANKIHGIEIFNDGEYYPASFDWCEKYNLGYVSNSDIHGLIDVRYGTAIRPFTIVFAEKKSEESLKKALFDNMTLAYFDGKLVGNKELLKKFVKASLEVVNVGNDVVEVYNNSDITYVLKTDSNTINLYAGKSVRITKVAKSYTVDNCYINSDEKLVISL